MRICQYIAPLLLLVAGCSPPEPGAVQFVSERLPYPRLSDYGFFSGELPELQPREGVVPYDLINTLFTDYADKARFLWMPATAQASIGPDGRIDFPDSTVLIKNFFYPHDFRAPEGGRDLVETRLLVRIAGQWKAYVYLWNENDTEAFLKPTGAFVEVKWIDETGTTRGTDYLVPNQNQCKSCHDRNDRLEPLGPKVENLLREQNYPDGRRRSQLSYWKEAGILPPAADWSGFSPQPRWNDPGSGSLGERALSYLDLNCGHCHRPEGPAHTTGLYLTSGGQTGLCKTPIAAGRGSGGRYYSIVPGSPEASILLYRMESDEPGVMMPEIGRTVAHREGIELIREWIAAMPGSCP